MPSSSSPDPQIQGEKILVTYMMSRVRAAAEFLRVKSSTTTTDSSPSAPSTSSRASSSSFLTQAEQPVFNRYTYYGVWTYGAPVAISVFGLTFGGLRFAAYRRWLRAQTLPNSSSYHAKASANRQHYASLDRTNGRSSVPSKKIATASLSSTSSSSSASATSNHKDSFNIFADEIAVQVQFMVTMALALMMGTMTSQLTYDITSFHRDLSQLPLAPGKSALCHAMCPQLLQQRDKLLHMSSVQQVYDDHTMQVKNQTMISAAAASPKSQGSTTTTIHSSTDASSTGPSSSSALLPTFDDATLQLEPQTLWSNPKTQDLESMVILVENCRLRMDYVDELHNRRRSQNRPDPFVAGDGSDFSETELIAVPPPGVPIRYHKSQTVE